jgi:hypothetical protein
MTHRMLLVPLAFACIVAAAGEPKTFTPEIHGMLTSGKQPVASNICLRQSDSEIRSCGYADASGRFLTADTDKKPLHFWLETGNVQSAQKLAPIEASVDRNAAIDLSCDMAQPGRSDPTFRACNAKPSQPLVKRVVRDDAPYRMARPVSPMK